MSRFRLRRGAAPQRRSLPKQAQIALSGAYNPDARTFNTLLHQWDLDESFSGTATDSVNGVTLSDGGRGFVTESGGVRVNKNATGQWLEASGLSVTSFPYAVVVECILHERGGNPVYRGNNADTKFHRIVSPSTATPSSPETKETRMRRGDGSNFEGENSYVSGTFPSVPDTTLLAFMVDSDTEQQVLSGRHMFGFDKPTSMPFDADRNESLRIGSFRTANGEDIDMTIRRVEVYASDLTTEWMPLVEAYESESTLDETFPIESAGVNGASVTTISRSGHSYSAVNARHNSDSVLINETVGSTRVDIATDMGFDGTPRLHLKPEGESWRTWRVDVLDALEYVNDFSTQRGYPLGEYPTTDNHNTSAVGVDQDNHIWVCANHHNDALQIARSDQPLPSFDGAFTRYNQLTGTEEDHITYPCFFNDDQGRLCITYRNAGDKATGGAGDGKRIVKRLTDSAANTWEPFTSGNAVIADGINSTTAQTFSIYGNGRIPVVDSNGAMHWCFNFRGPNGPDDSFQVSYLQINADGTAEQADGTLVSLPVTDPANVDVVDPFADQDDGVNRLSDIGGFDLDSQGRPHTCYSKYDGGGNRNFYHAYWDGSTWQIDQITSHTGGDPVLALCTMALDSSDVAHVVGTKPDGSVGTYLWRSSDYSTWTQTQLVDDGLLVGADGSGHIDRERLESDGVVSLFLAGFEWLGEAGGTEDYYATLPVLNVEYTP